MLDIKIFRENKELVIAGLKKKNFKTDPFYEMNIEDMVEEIIDLDKTVRELTVEIEGYTSVMNRNSGEISKLMKVGNTEQVNVLKTIIK